MVRSVASKVYGRTVELERISPLLAPGGDKARTWLDGLGTAFHDYRKWTVMLLVLQVRRLRPITDSVFSNSFHIYQAEIFPTAIRSAASGVTYSLSRATATFLPFVTIPLLLQCRSDSGIHRLSRSHRAALPRCGIARATQHRPDPRTDRLRTADRVPKWMEFNVIDPVEWPVTVLAFLDVGAEGRRQAAAACA